MYRGEQVMAVPTKVTVECKRENRAKIMYMYLYS